MRIFFYIKNIEEIDKFEEFITIDVRTKKEFDEMPLFSYNLEIINEEEHKVIKKFYPCAFFVILKSLLLKRKEIKKTLIDLSKKKKKKVIFACSRGRLRSPAMYIYGRFLGLQCYILKGGLKRFFEEEKIEKNFLIKFYNYITFK